MKRIAAIIAVFLCFTMISGSFASANLNNNTIKDLTGLTTSNKTLTVFLPYNPAKLDHWVAEYDHSKVKLLSSIHLPINPIYGSDLLLIFRFEGKKDSTVKMKYVSFDGTVIKECIFTIK